MINKRQSVQDSNTKKRRRHNSSDNSNTEMSTEESNIPITSLINQRMPLFFDLLRDVVGILDSSVDISVLLLSNVLCLGRFFVLESCTL